MRLARTLSPTAAPLAARDLMAMLGGWSARGGARIESEMREFCAATDVLLLSSGRAALTLLLGALTTLRRGRRGVAIPAYTCYSVPAAIIKAGLEPVLVDVDPQSLDFDEQSLRTVAQRHDLLCVLPTHLFGVVVDVARARTIVGADVFVVEDAAQAFGVVDRDGRRLGTTGDAAIFSLARGKHLTAGHGGVIITRLPDVARACRPAFASLATTDSGRTVRTGLELLLMSAFIDPRLYWLPAGLPFLGLGHTEYSTAFAIERMSPAAIGALRHWRQRLARDNDARSAVVSALREALSPSIDRATGPLLRFPLLLPSAEQRTQFIERASAVGLGVSTMYPTAVHHIPELQPRYSGQRYPGAELLAARMVTLPTHRFVRPVDVARLHELHHDVLAHSVREGAPSALPA